MVGYFKVWRDLFDKPIWLNSTPEQKVILITLIKMANWKDVKWEWKGKPYHCEPGEFITSYNSIINVCGKGVTYQNVRTAIKRFQNYEFLTYQITVGEYGGIKIKLNNWNKYQKETNISPNTSLTDCQHISNTSLTPIEEYKESKERKNDKYSNPTKEEILNYIHSLCKKINVDDFINYYNASGWTDKDGLPINWKQKALYWANSYKEPELDDIERRSKLIKKLEEKARKEGKI